MQTTESPKKYSNSDLNERLKILVASERKITREILELINLVELRSLHLQMSYSSLFDYLTKYLGYNESAAYRRMQAARLLRDCPEMSGSLQTGKLHLTQMAQLQTAIKAQQKQSHQVIDRETKLQLLAKLENKTSSETQKILAQEFGESEVKAPAKPVQYQKDESVYLTLHLSKEQYECLIKTKNLMSHISNGKTEDVLECLCKKEIHRRTTISQKVSQKVSKRTDCSVKDFSDRKISAARAPIPTALRREFFNAEACCQYEDPLSRKKCETKFQLQLDHLQPVWAGGGSEKSNLQILCAAHNRLRYQQEAGIRIG